MALALVQAGTGGALCVYAAPLPDKAGPPDATTAPGMPAATLAALGPVPCVVTVNARGVESPQEIMAFARAKRGGTELWWAALIGVSRGCQKARDLWMAGAGALCLVLIDGMAGQNPPTSMQLGFAQTAVALARSGAILLVVSHTYIEQGKAITSTAEMARTATGWALAPPPAGETVRRAQAPAGDPPQPPAWRGGLVVFSTGSGPADGNAHQDQIGRLLPLILADRVRPLVNFAERPEVVTSEVPTSSPEPEAEAGPWSRLRSPPSRASTVAPASLAPRPRGEGRTPIDRSATLGERAAQWSIEEQRDGVHEDPPHSNRSPRIDQYRQNLGSPGDNWCAYGFCYAAFATLNPGESLPHVYSGRVAELVRTGSYHPKGDGYAPHVGDGAIFRRDRQDPTTGGNGHIGRVLALPDADGSFATVEANSGDAWALRVHRLDEADFVGWLAYPQGQSKPVPAPSVPQTILVEELGRLPLEQYVARVVTGEFGLSRQFQALAALAMAARTYAVWLMKNMALGTEAKPMPNSTRTQVVARAATPLAAEATRATEGGLILYKHQPILACHNAGAIWLPGALTGAGGRDPTDTEKNITYNGLTGRAAKPTRIARADVEGNRGCLSQNGADALAARGLVWPEVLRYFYGADIDFNVPEPASRRSPPAPRPTPTPTQAPRPSSSPGGDLFFPVAAALSVFAVSRAFG